MADESRKILLELSLNTVEAVKNQAELKKLLKETNVELSNAAIGSEEYQKLEKVQGLLQNRLKGLQTATKQSTSELNVQKGSLRDLQSQYAGLTRALREAAPGTEVLGMSFEDAKKRAFELKEEIKGFEAELGNTAPNVGNYGESIKGAFENAAGGVQVFGTNLLTLFKAILTNPIGIILTALTLLANILLKNNAIADVFNGVMKGFEIIMSQIVDTVSAVVQRMTNFGGESSKTSKILKEGFVRVLNQLLAPLNLFLDLLPALEKALEGDFSGAADIAAEAGKEFGRSIVFMNDEMPKFVENIIEATKVGIEYEETLGDIEERQSKLNVETARLTNERDRLILQSKDLSRTEEERIALNERAVAIDKRILNQRLALLDEEIAAQAKYVKALGGDNDKREEEEFKLNDLQVKRLELINQNLKFEELAQNKRNAIIEKQLAEQEKLAKEEEEARKKREKEEAELVEKIRNNENKLEQFRLDLAAKRATDIDDKLKKQLAAEDFRVQVLLSNDKLLASEREFILADSEARQLDLKIAADKARIDQEKKTQEERKAVILQANQQVQDYTNQTASILQNINQIALQDELYILEKQKEAQLKIAGNNAAKREKVEADFAKRREKIERDSAKRANAIALIQALINTSLAVTKALSVLPPPASFISAALQGAAGAVQVASIISNDNKLEDGGLIKAGFGRVIGGKPHSMGGTKFYGEDGTRFEAERGELIAVVNKKDTPLLSQLNAVNSIHGKPFFRDGGIFSPYLADGGFALRASSAPVESSINTRNDILDIVSSMPNPVVLVEDINVGQDRNVKVSSRANI